MSERRRAERKGDMALSLIGVTVNDAHTVDVQHPDARLVQLRDLAAICGETAYRVVEPDEGTVQRVSDVVLAYSARSPVLPAPVGVVFRSEEAVQRWMELHYSALSGALAFVENRVAARVHVWRPGDPDERDAGSDLAAIAAESMRVLRRAAVASVPLRTEKITGIVLSAAFLVEDELWKAFGEEVEAQGRMATSVRFELTGPWPPYDFVQMQLGV